MIRVGLVAGGDKPSQLADLASQFDYWVGIDRGALTLLEAGLPLDLAVGDFDSVSDQDLDLISSQAKSCHQAAAEKDDTDTELALKLVFEQFPEAQATVFGAFGGRVDHFLSNIFLPSDPNLAPFMGQICLRDATNHISYVPAGRHQISPVPGMTYVSFMTEESSQLTILGAKYDLTSSNFFKKKIYSSNEFVGQPIELTLDQGYALVIQTKDRR